MEERRQTLARTEEQLSQRLGEMNAQELELGRRLELREQALADRERKLDTRQQTDALAHRILTEEKNELAFRFETLLGQRSKHLGLIQQLVELFVKTRWEEDNGTRTTTTTAADKHAAISLAEHIGAVCRAEAKEWDLKLGRGREIDRGGICAAVDLPRRGRAEEDPPTPSRGGNVVGGRAAAEERSPERVVVVPEAAVLMSGRAGNEEDECGRVLMSGEDPRRNAGTGGSASVTKVAEEPRGNHVAGAVGSSLGRNL